MKSQDSYQAVGQFVEDRYQAIKFYGCTNPKAPAVYVGTYAKYACGSIDGAWIDLSKCHDVEEFYEVCRALHDDEANPEFMFQDFMNFPECFYCEACLNEEQFQNIIDFYTDVEDVHAFEAYCKVFDNPNVEHFKEVYKGEYSSEAEFAEEEYGEYIENELGSLYRFFDWEAYARDLFIEDYRFRDGYVFEYLH